MSQIELENKISLLRDERARNGWNNKEATEHEYLMEKLRVNFPKSKYA